MATRVKNKRIGLKFTFNGEPVTFSDTLKMYFFEGSDRKRLKFSDSDNVFTQKYFTTTELLAKLGVDLEQDRTIEVGKES